MPDPAIPNPESLLARTRCDRADGAVVRRLRRPSRRAAVRLCVQRLLAIDSADHATDLRQMRRSIASSQRRLSGLLWAAVASDAARGQSGNTKARCGKSFTRSSMQAGCHLRSRLPHRCAFAAMMSCGASIASCPSHCIGGASINGASIRRGRSRVISDRRLSVPSSGVARHVRRLSSPPTAGKANVAGAFAARRRLVL